MRDLIRVLVTVWRLRQMIPRGPSLAWRIPVLVVGIAFVAIIFIIGDIVHFIATHRKAGTRGYTEVHTRSV